MKKAFFKFLLVFLGLNLFTACYGPAPGVREYQEVEPTEQTESTKAEDEVEAEEESLAGNLHQALHLG